MRVYESSNFRWPILINRYYVLTKSILCVDFQSINHLELIRLFFYSRKSHCLVWILVWRGHWPVLFPKWSWRRHNCHRGEIQSTITNFLMPKLENMDITDMWFQQDGEPRVTQRMQHWHDKFDGMVRYLAFRRSQLATKIVWFNAIRLFLVGLC